MSLVNENKSAGKCKFVHIYWKKPFFKFNKLTGKKQFA